MLLTRNFVLSCISVGLVLGGCASQRAGEPASAGDEQLSGGATAAALSCSLQAIGDSGVGGTLTFSAAEEGVLIEGEITGLTPNGKHGFHVHEKGDCSAPDGKSAGGHFNPEGVEHGAHDAAPSHVGDLGNVEADENGMAKVKVLKRGAALTAGDTAYLGRGVIVHMNADDLTSQPTGAAGPRIACGVITAE